MVPGDHREAAVDAGGGGGAGVGAGPVGAADSHWVRWHGAYEDPSSGLSERLRRVQAMVRGALDDMTLDDTALDDTAAGGDRGGDGGHDRGDPIRIISLCAGQGRDVIDVLATHPAAGRVEALLVDLDPALVAFARRRAVEAGLGDRVRVEQGDASLCELYAGSVPADVVLVCGIFGNVSDEDIAATIRALPAFCRPGANVIWTRHRRPPDATPAIRAQFAEAGFTEISFDAPDGFVLGTGRHRLDGDPGKFGPFDPGRRLFDFVGDGSAPA
jgi:SAM-dependent methyltransferase